MLMGLCDPDACVLTVVCVAVINPQRLSVQPYTMRLDLEHVTSLGLSFLPEIPCSSTSLAFSNSLVKRQTGQHVGASTHVYLSLPLDKELT